MSTDRDWLRERLEELERIQRPSASEGERRAAEWLVARLAELGAEGIADAFPAGQRRLRRVRRKRTTYNVVCELGPADAERTIVVIAHHDAAHSGLVFHPELPQIADRLGMIERTDTSPPLMAPVLGGPVLVALGALTGRRPLSNRVLRPVLGSPPP